MQWETKIAVITGANTGIGYATKKLLREKGCTVYNLDLLMQDNEDAAYFISCDVRNRRRITESIDAVHKKAGRIDFLFANAGIHLFAGIEETTDDAFDNVVGTNLIGTFYTLKAILPLMKLQGSGSIVLMGSDQTFVGKAKSAVYGLTKAAIGQLAKSTAIDYAPHNIRVNCICPGTIDTPLLHKAVDHYADITMLNKPDIYKSLDAAQPLGKIGQPNEIAAAVAFLLSDDASFMTGSLMVVDGGYTSQ